jgi:hypothetical protein
MISLDPTETQLAYVKRRLLVEGNGEEQVPPPYEGSDAAASHIWPRWNKRERKVKEAGLDPCQSVVCNNAATEVGSQHEMEAKTKTHHVSLLVRR